VTKLRPEPQHDYGGHAASLLARLPHMAVTEVAVRTSGSACGRGLAISADGAGDSRDER